MDPDLLQVVAPLRADPARSVLLFDFDGTLSPVVADPAAAVPAPGVVERLDRLAGSYLRVGALSGRPVSFLAQHLPPSMVLSGLYGLESLVDGVTADHPEAQHWRPVVERAVRGAQQAAGPGGTAEGVVVEAKGLSITLHVRTRPELGPAVSALADALAAETGLLVRPAKMSVELHPPIDADKGSALRGLAGGARAVLYAGDDVGDLPAFAALDDLVASGPGVTGVGVVVGGPELPDALLAPGRVVLPGQASVSDLLDTLLV